jgi:hypothetical protein
MAFFIIKDDFKSHITLADLDRVTDSNDAIWQQNLGIAIEFESSFMRQRYDVDAVFTPIETWVDQDWPIGTRVQDGGLLYYAIQSVTTGTLISDTDFWTQADNRNQKIVEITIDIILFNIYNRLNGSEIPNYLQIRYDGADGQQRGGAVGYLKEISKGTVQADLPLLADVIDGTRQSGNNIIFGQADDVILKHTTI